jgi:hypothetical protein
MVVRRLPQALIFSPDGSRVLSSPQASSSWF